MVCASSTVAKKGDTGLGIDVTGAGAIQVNMEGHVVIPNARDLLKNMDCTRWYRTSFRKIANNG